ncbi:hypothetical protein P152DRAFT_453646 [Eremomyces bilateralis CBS 781.70]|uniref:Monooxygenase n=1 Tax=Eremomyces bilateralis CBS 781.70 TaxID=1392243 RepID=A0A6G1GG00_9PEZI|nr:uncharacterized protein P152DRAFT_453646 [Eremomyces bilateralis CBS 781.70]KAF1817035.1 hypothetical protein P152DRAFT_453646 [Eremomyces bilateralis CBS 781.70]
MAFSPLLSPSPNPIPSETTRQVRGSFGLAVLRDQFALPTIIAIGAVLQSILTLILPLRVALLPGLVWLTWATIDTVAQTKGWKKNEYLENVAVGRKTSAQVPSAGGQFGDKPSDGSVVVLLLGVRINHPMGVFSPNGKKIGEYFAEMGKSLEKEMDKYGMLGSGAWLGGGERSTSNGIMYLYYFRDVEGVHKFAHDPIHRRGWEWWNKIVKEGTADYLSIWHEVYSVPSGNWESVYINSHPVAHGAARYKIPSEKPEGRDIWVNPLVDASRGVLRSSAGRMSRSNGKEHEKYGDNPYAV